MSNKKKNDQELRVNVISIVLVLILLLLIAFAIFQSRDSIETKFQKNIAPVIEKKTGIDVM